MSRAIVGLLAVALLYSCGATSAPTATSVATTAPTGSLGPSAPPSEASPTTSPSPTPTAVPPTASASPRLTTPPPIGPSPIPGVVAPWAERTDVGLGQITDLWATAERNGTYVVSGQPQAADSWDAQLWYSDDFQNWHLATVPDQPHIDRIHAIAPTSDGFAALGLDSSDDVLTDALISPDGRTWQVAGSFAGTGTYLAQINGRLLAFGNNSWKSDPWYSDDGGSTWLPFDSDSGLAVANGLLALYQVDGYLWAVRSDDQTEDASIKTPVELWRTVDGRAWSKVLELPGSIAAGGAQLVSGPGGWVLTARRTTFDEMEQLNEWSAWWSSDGLEWKASRSAPQHIDRIIADEHGFLAVGGDPGPCCVLEESNVRANIWTSRDGQSWHQMSQQGWHGREIDFITSVGDMVDGVGIDWKFAPGRDSVGWGVGWQTDRANLTTAQ